MSDARRPVTEVAAGILLDARQRFLMGQRPTGKPYAGYWEFPGGKVEVGETLFQALQRELHEELGITIHGSVDLMTIEHDYPHAYVRIHVSVIQDWSGEPTGCENQALSWQDLNSDQLTVDPLLPAALPMIQELKQFYAEIKTGTKLV
ncbi:MAG: NUDIX domain-containing protein [Polynucleobacter sp.]|jgi:8-oxo-dGTP diphosphatase|nr:NUDIX domain-containing protein [Polynucleobacter sp.]